MSTAELRRTARDRPRSSIDLSATRGSPLNETPAKKRMIPHGSMRVWALMPFAVFALVLVVYPLSQIARMSLSDVSIREGGFTWEWLGSDNYSWILANSSTWQTLANTATFVIASTLLTIITGLFLAVLVDRSTTLLPVARNVIIWPAVIAPVVVSLMWLLILSPTAGGLNKLLRTFGVPEQGWLGTEFGAMSSIVLVDVWHWTPIAFLFLYTAIKGIDSSVLEAARMDGANEWSILRRIILPLLVPTIGAVAIVRTVMGIKAFDEMYLLTRGGPNGATTLVSQQVKILFFDNLYLGRGAAYSLTVVGLVVAALAAYWIVRRNPRLGGRS